MIKPRAFGFGTAEPWVFSEAVSATEGQTLRESPGLDAAVLFAETTSAKQEEHLSSNSGCELGSGFCYTQVKISLSRKIPLPKVNSVLSEVHPSG